MHLVAVPLLAALAGPPRAELAVEWRLEDGCPSRQVLDAQVARLVAAPSIATRATIIITDATPPAWSLEVTIEQSGRAVSRRLQHESCEVLARAAILILAVHLNPIELAVRLDETMTAGDVEPPAPDVEPPAPIVAPPDPVVEPVPPAPRDEAPAPARDAATPRAGAPLRGADRPRTRLELRGALRAQGAVGLAALPDLDGGGGLVLALFARPFRVELGASAWALGQYVHPTADVASSLRFWSGSLRAGPSARLGPIELHVLGHFEVGALIVSAAPLENASRQTAAWIALGLAPSLAWAPHRNVALWLGVEGFGVLLRPRYTIGALGDYYVARPAGVRGVLGVEARFP